MASSRPRSNSKASKLVEKLKDKISPTKGNSKRKRDDERSSVSQDHSTQSPDRPVKRLKSGVDPSSESSQNIPKGKAEKSNTAKPPKKSKRELKVEAERKRLEDFYNEKSNFFAQFDSFELKSLTPKKNEGRKGAMDPLDASLEDIEPNDVDLDFLLDSEKTDKSQTKKRRRSSRLQQQDSNTPKSGSKKGSDKLPEAKKFFDTNLDALASSNIDGDHLSELPKSKPPRRPSARGDSASDVEEKLGKERDFEYEETPPVIYNSESAFSSVARSLGQSGGVPIVTKKGSKKEIIPLSSSSMKAPEKPVERKRSARQIAASNEPSQPLPPPEQRHTRQSSRGKKPREGLENPELLEEYNDYLEEEHREGNLAPWSLQEYYEKVWKAAGFK